MRASRVIPEKSTPIYFHRIILMVTAILLLACSFKSCEPTLTAKDVESFENHSEIPNP